MHAQFRTYPLNTTGQQKALAISEAFDELLTKLEKLVPEGLQLGMCQSMLEQACFFAKKGMAMDSSNQGGGQLVANAGTPNDASKAFDHRQCVHPMESGSWCTNTARLGSPFCDEHGKPIPEEK